jgi:hypothetical protein
VLDIDRKQLTLKSFASDVVAVWTGSQVRSFPTSVGVFAAPDVVALATNASTNLFAWGVKDPV